MFWLNSVVSAYDNALYLWFDPSDENKLMGVLVSHVDDFAFCGNNKFHVDVIEKVKDTFSISVHETGSFKYLGLSVCQTDNGVSIHQNNYISSIAPISLPQDRYRGVGNYWAMGITDQGRAKLVKAIKKHLILKNLTKLFMHHICTRKHYSLITI